MGRETPGSNREEISNDLNIDQAKSELLPDDLRWQMTNKAVGIEPQVTGRYNEESDPILRKDPEVQEKAKEEIGTKAFLFYEKAINQYLNTKKEENIGAGADKIKKLEKGLESFKAGLNGELCDFSNLVVPEDAGEQTFEKTEAQLTGQLINALKESILTDDIQLKWDILKIIHQLAILEVMQNPDKMVRDLFTVEKGLEQRSQATLTNTFVKAWTDGDFEAIAGLNTVKGAHPNETIRNTSYLQDKRTAINNGLRKSIDQIWPLLSEAGKALSAVRDLDVRYRKENVGKRDGVLTSLQNWLKKNVTYNDREKVNGLAFPPQSSEIEELVNGKLRKTKIDQQDQENSRQEKQNLYDEKYKTILYELRKEMQKNQKAILNTKKAKRRKLSLLDAKWELEIKRLEKNSKEGGIGIAPFKKLDVNSIPPSTIEQYAQRDALYQAREEIKESLPQEQTQEYL
ncbi:MAG: hypothetical protein ABH896_00395 [Candidatus Jacksonbacteria bacterium]